MKPNIKAVIYDLDGTLLNSGKEGYRRLIALGRQYNIEITNEVERRLHENWGLDPENLIMKGFNVPLVIAQEIHNAWSIWDKNDPIPLVTGVPEMLQKNIFDKGIANFVFTSRKTKSAINVLKSFSIAHLFEEVVGTTGGIFVRKTGLKKPDPRALKNLLVFINDYYNISRENIAYVGDEIFDIQCGIGAGLLTYGVTSGLKTKEELHGAGAPLEMIYSSVINIEF